MYNSEQITALVKSFTIRSYKNAVSDTPVKLSKEQSNVLGQTKRNMIRFIKTAINAISDKLEVQNIDITDAQSKIAVDAWLKANKFDNTAHDIYKAVVRDGITYVLVAFKDGIPTITQVDSYDGKCGAYTVYNELTGAALYTTNLWYANGQTNLDIYYPERIEKYYYNDEDNEWYPRYDYEGETFPIDWTNDVNEPLGIALVAFDIGESDITEAVQIQHDMNEALVDILATSRTMGWPQLVLKNASQETFLLNQFEQPLVNVTGGYPIPRKIERTPGSILMLQGDNSDLIQLPSAPVDTALLDKLEALMSQVTTVPTFYFGSAVWPSGIALQMAEGKLNHKCEGHQGFLTPSIETMIRMMLNVNNTFNTIQYNANVIIEVTWFTVFVETDDLRMQKQDSLTKNLVLLSGAGLVSIETAIRMLHSDWDDTQIADEVRRIQEDKQRENIAVASALG